jgi:polyhydroxyalkanoate synthesis regulator phasin
MKTLCVLLPTILLLSATGCVTMMDDTTAARQSSDMDILRENVQRLQERMNAVQMEQQNLAREIDALRKGGHDENPAARARVDDLERQVRALNAAREQDRKSIVDELSRKVAGIMSSQSGGSSSRSGSSSETGYEHVVKTGETLSQIAKAYKVSSSAIMKANNLKSANIRVGQKLFIPQ